MYPFLKLSDSSTYWQLTYNDIFNCVAKVIGIFPTRINIQGQQKYNVVKGRVKTIYLIKTSRQFIIISLK